MSQLSLNILLLKAESFSPTKRMIVQRFIPFPATCERVEVYTLALASRLFVLTCFLFVSASASAVNAFLMRKHELSEGIEVLDVNGKVVGTSQVAAKNVSQQCIYTWEEGTNPM